MTTTKYPSLYQINTRVWLTELSQELQKKATLDDISDAELDELGRKGFDWIWLLSAASYDWNGDHRAGRGLFLDMAPWAASVFSITLCS